MNLRGPAEASGCKGFITLKVQAVKHMTQNQASILNVRKHGFKQYQVDGKKIFAVNSIPLLRNFLQNRNEYKSIYKL
jgi:hypothetical protein